MQRLVQAFTGAGPLRLRGGRDDEQHCAGTGRETETHARKQKESVTHAMLDPDLAQCKGFAPAGRAVELAAAPCRRIAKAALGQPNQRALQVRGELDAQVRSAGIEESHHVYLVVQHAVHQQKPGLETVAHEAERLVQRKRGAVLRVDPERQLTHT